MLTYQMRCGILVSVSIAAVIALLMFGPIPQDPAYHLFADSRKLSGIGNFWNVVSNLPFVLVGAWGLSRYPRLLNDESSQGYRIMCIAAVLVGFGSAYYHYAPTNQTLLWDRLPMTVAFMALMSLLLGERVLPTHQPSLLWILLAAGVAAALYWSWTESLGRGDLRPYALIQFLPIVLMPLILVMFPQRYLKNKFLLWSFGCYFVAKALEHFDRQLLSATGFISGHPVKHVAAAAAVLCLVCAVPARAGCRLSDVQPEG